MASTAVRANGHSVLSASALRALTRVGGLLLLALGIALLIALWSYDPGDPSFNHATSEPVRNLMGAPGATASDLLLQLFGLGAWPLVVVLAGWGLRIVAGRRLTWPWLPVVALPITLLATGAFLALFEAPRDWAYLPGGLVGDFLHTRLARISAATPYAWGAAILAIAGWLVSIGLRWDEVFWGARRTGTAAVWVGGHSTRLGAAAFGASGRAVGRGLRHLDGMAQRRRAAGSRPPATSSALETSTITSGFAFVGRLTAGLAERLRPDPLLDPADGDGRDAPQVRRRPPRRRKAPGRPPEPETSQTPRPATPQPIELDRADGFELPQLDLLTASDNRASSALSRAALEDTSRRLETVLDDFGVRGAIIGAEPGPVVTRYELEPAPGTRAARVISLADDIARSLCAVSVRVAVVPGRNIIGIEIPNDRRETVYLKELLSSPGYESTSARLTLALGKDIAGAPVIVDLARMPHLLIAGTTGSGKSVAINAMILSLMFRLSPEECKIIMIDPKVIELSVYEGIPHLLAPVVTEPGKAIVALKWIVRQMDERYRMMSHLGVRDIFAYNRRIQRAIEAGDQLNRRVQTGFDPDTGAPVFEDQPIEMRPMPLIVVIVDEVADLMLTAGKEIEAAIQRLSQKARAAGIHLIVATQRPSVDVLTGVIKANLPSRISFRVSSKIDSRTVLGEPGAEQLLGQGDLLFMMPGEKMTRIHGPLVTDAEVERVVTYLKSQGEPDYVDGVTDEDGGEADPQLGLSFGEDNADDALYQKAVTIVARDGKASTSYLQRQLRIGYNSAARLIERMEREGLISTANHVGQRQVLMGRGGVNGDEPTVMA